MALPPLPPLSAKKVLDDLPFPSGAPTPPPAPPSTPHPTSQGTWAWRGRCQLSGLINQFVHNVYCFNQPHHPRPALAFASLMPACCNRPSPPLPIPSTASHLPRRQDRDLATSFANLGWWSGPSVLLVLAYRPLASASGHVGSPLFPGPVPSLFPSQLPSLPTPPP